MKGMKKLQEDDDDDDEYIALKDMGTQNQNGQEMRGLVDVLVQTNE